MRYVVEIIWQQGKRIPYQVMERDFEKLNKVQVAYYQYKDNIEISDILEHPTFLVNDVIKKVMELYEENIRFKGLQLYPTELSDKISPFYWIPMMEEVECLHPESIVFPNGEIKDFMLSGRRLGDKDIFRVGGIKENRVIITLPVAESILRRKAFGVALEEVRVENE